MLKHQRHQAILSQLETTNSFIINDVVNAFDCSVETLRRDLIELEKAGKLIRTHGGAYLQEKFNKRVPISLKKTMLVKEKDTIANHAFDLIEEHAFIFLDHSSTCSRLAKKISLSDKPVSIITNSTDSCVIIASSNNPFIKLVHTGGVYNSKNDSYYGRVTIDTIKRFHASMAFISCPHINPKLGLTDNCLESASVRENMIKQSDKLIVIMDHTKIDGNADVIIKPLNAVNTLVCDKPLAADMAEACTNLNIKVIH